AIDLAGMPSAITVLAGSDQQSEVQTAHCFSFSLILGPAFFAIAAVYPASAHSSMEAMSAATALVGCHSYGSSYLSFLRSLPVASPAARKEELLSLQIVARPVASMEPRTGSSNPHFDRQGLRDSS